MTICWGDLSAGIKGYWLVMGYDLILKYVKIVLVLTNLFFVAPFCTDLNHTSALWPQAFYQQTVFVCIMTTIQWTVDFSRKHLKVNWSWQQADCLRPVSYKLGTPYIKSIFFCTSHRFIIDYRSAKVYFLEPVFFFCPFYSFWYILITTNWAKSDNTYYCGDAEIKQVYSEYILALN